MMDLNTFFLILSMFIVFNYSLNQLVSRTIRGHNDKKVCITVHEINLRRINEHKHRFVL